MKAEKLRGNLVSLLIKGEIDILFHQANCFNTMNAGVAYQIKKVFPEAYEMDCLTRKGDKKKLGQFSFAFVDNDAQAVICNLYGQYRYGKAGPQYTDYDALWNALENARDWLLKAGFEGKTIGLPLGMGCQLGGGDWAVVSKMIDHVFENTSFRVLLVEWDKTKV
jgi:O-acetyl-ADP-ribose deacetylase (regulator of RNase III)